MANPGFYAPGFDDEDEIEAPILLREREKGTEEIPQPTHPVIPSPKPAKPQLEFNLFDDSL